MFRSTLSYIFGFLMVIKASVEIATGSIIGTHRHGEITYRHDPVMFCVMIGVELAIAVFILATFIFVRRMRAEAGRLRKIIDAAQAEIDALAKPGAYPAAGSTSEPKAPIVIKPNLAAIIPVVLVVEALAIGTGLLMFPFAVLPGGMNGFIVMVIAGGLFTAVYLIKAMKTLSCRECNRSLRFDRSGKATCEMCRIDYVSSVATK
jgi:hypothetical protein